MKYALKSKTVWSHFEKRFSHKTHARFRHSGFVTLYAKFAYIITINSYRKMEYFCTVFTNILFHYTHHLANNE